MTAKRLADGTAAYYWEPTTRDRRAGCPVQSEALGRDYAAAIDRARLLNASLAAWRQGQGTSRDLDHGHRYGTLAWLAERYMRSEAWKKVSERARRCDTNFRRWAWTIAFKSKSARSNNSLIIT